MTSSNGAFLIFFALAMIYAVLVAFAGVRLQKLHHFSPEWKHAKFFYCILIFQAAVRCCVFLILGFDSRVKDSRTIFFLLSVPDSLFMITYILMFWQLLSVFYYAHHEPSSRSGILKAITRRPQESWVSCLFVAVILLWVALQTGFYLALFITAGKALSEGFVWTEVAIANISGPTSAFMTMVILQIAYSGRPVRTEAWKQKLTKMNIIIVIWSLGRYCDGILSLCDSKVINDIDNMASPSGTAEESLFNTALLIAYLIVCEVICMFLVLDYGFMAIFVLSESESRDRDWRLENPPLLSQQINDPSTTEVEGTSRRFSVLSTSPMIFPEELTISESLPSRRNCLGEIHRGTFKGHPVFCRKIAFPRISSYVIEEFSEEIEVLRLLEVPYLAPFYGAVINIPTICIVSPFFSQGSLYQAVHSNAPISRTGKLLLALNLAKGLKTLHDLNRVHGHLSSHNVMLDEEMRPYITDLGLGKIRKYAGLIMGYVSKNAWTSPELLAEKSSTPIKVRPSDDIYSFGVILWELITGQEPFPNQSRTQLYNMVVRDQLRPEIPHDLPSGLTNLIINCWNRDPEKRADFTLVYNMLKRELESERDDM